MSEILNEVKQKDCDLFEDCGSCIENDRCGWCESERKCVDGNENLPLYTTCSFYQSNTCDISRCSKHKNCFVQQLTIFITFLGMHRRYLLWLVLKKTTRLELS